MKKSPVDGLSDDPELMSAGLAYFKSQGEVVSEAEAMEGVLHVAVAEKDLQP